MHTRQVGAAHINIFYFLIILVLALFATFFGYHQLTEATRLQGERDAANEALAQTEIDNLILRHYAEDIGAAIGIPGTYSGRENRSGDYRIDDPQGGDPIYQAADLENVAGIAEIQDQIRELSRNIGVSEAQTLPELLNRVQSTYNAQAQQVADAQAQIQQLQSEKSAADQSFAAASQQSADELRQALDAQATTRQSLESELATKDGVIQGLTDAVQTARAQLSSEQEERVAEVRAITETRNRIQAQNDALSRKYSLINPPQAPDGRVITAHPRLGVAVIDLGRKDMLQPGTVFQILDPDRPGQVKAIGTVTDVSDEQSNLAISEVADPFRPVTNGDLISNELYSPNIRRNIYLMGRFGYPFNKASVKALLERLGNTVVDEIQPGVDLVVVGNELVDEETGTLIPLDETPEYREVLNLSIEIAPLNRLHDLLKFDER